MYRIGLHRLNDYMDNIQRKHKQKKEHKKEHKKEKNVDATTNEPNEIDNDSAIMESLSDETIRKSTEITNIIANKNDDKLAQQNNDDSSDDDDSHIATIISYCCPCIPSKKK